MTSKYIPFLQQELRQRYDYARLGRPLLSSHIPERSLDPKADYDQELLAYMRPIALADLLEKHISDLVPRQALMREIERFCRDTVRLNEMARQEYDAERRETASKSCHARRFETPLKISTVMEIKEGLPHGSLQAAYEAEAREAQRVAEDFMRQCVEQENSKFA
jgi:hypothetical protein